MLCRTTSEKGQPKQNQRVVMSRPLELLYPATMLQLPAHSLHPSSLSPFLPTVVASLGKTVPQADGVPQAEAVQQADTVGHRLPQSRQRTLRTKGFES